MTRKSRRAMFAALPLLLIELPAVAQDIGKKLYGSWRVVSFNIRRPKGSPKRRRRRRFRHGLRNLHPIQRQPPFSNTSALP